MKLTLKGASADDAKKLFECGIQSTILLRPPYARRRRTPRRMTSTPTMTSLVAWRWSPALGWTATTPHSYAAKLDGSARPADAMVSGTRRSSTAVDALDGHAGWSQPAQLATPGKMLEDDKRVIFELVSLTIDAHLPVILHGGGGPQRARCRRCSRHSRWAAAAAVQTATECQWQHADEDVHVAESGGSPRSLIRWPWPTQGPTTARARRR